MTASAIAALKCTSATGTILTDCVEVLSASDTYFTYEIAPVFILGCSFFAIFWGTIAGIMVRKIDMTKIEGIQACLDEFHKTHDDDYYKLHPDEDRLEEADEILEQINHIGVTITKGAEAFLLKEYIYLTIWSLLFSLVLGTTVDMLEMKDESNPTDFPYTATSYLIGSITSIIAGYIGMKIAVYTNTRVTYQCVTDVHAGFLAAFRGGQVLGFVLVGLALLNLMIIVIVYRAAWWAPQADRIFKSNESATEWKGESVFTELKYHSGGAAGKANAAAHYMSEADFAKYEAAVSVLTRRLFELVAGYGLGGSSVALFGRVGGGIYTKAADVGADLVGKTLKGLKEDDITNPGTIADNVGDNVGDIAGMGSDLFGSLAESTCAALVVSATSIDLIKSPDALFFPLAVTASGIVASFLSVLFVHVRTTTVANVQGVLITQIGLSTLLMSVTVIPAMYLLPETFQFIGGAQATALTATRWNCFGCVMFGLWSGMIIGFVTNYYTNNAFNPTKELAEACKKGPAPNIILGIALGYHSCIIPILCLTATIGWAFSCAGMYGVGLSALGMLGSLPVALSVDGFGPIADNAGGVAEMSGLPTVVRDQTDALDAAGNTTAAVGKGFAIGSACLVGLALFGAFITRIGDSSVDILKPTQFAGLLVGAMLPYAFSALTMKAVGDAAYKMMDFIEMDFKKVEEYKRKNPNWKAVKGDKVQDKGSIPDYEGCIKISTDESLINMIAPGILVIGSPLAAGFLFGPSATAGLLAGTIVSGVQVAISASNTGGAWDNAKKEVEGKKVAFRIECEEKKINIDKVVEQYHELADKEENFEDNRANWSAEFKEIEKMAVYQIQLKEMHVAAVVGDTVGDPLKDTSGPSINILIKLSAITSLVFGSYLKNYHVWGNKVAK